MLGLIASCKQIGLFESGLLFAVFVLLHGGSQAGDPAILSNKQCQSNEPSLLLGHASARHAGGHHCRGWSRSRHRASGPETNRGRTYVALEGALENELLSHTECFVDRKTDQQRRVGLKIRMGVGGTSVW